MSRLVKETKLTTHQADREARARRATPKQRLHHELTNLWTACRERGLRSYVSWTIVADHSPLSTPRRNPLRSSQAQRRRRDHHRPALCLAVDAGVENGPTEDGRGAGETRGLASAGARLVPV